MSEVNKNDSEKTRIVNSGDTSHPENDMNQSSEKKDNLKSLKDAENKDNSKRFSAGMFAAGAGAAAAGGVATGAIFSDDIKGFVNPEDDSSKQPEEAVEQNATSDPKETINEVAFSENDPKETEIGTQENQIHVEYTDSEGVYEVSITDINGDGNFDSMTVEAELIDGSHIEYAASGTALDSLMNSEGFQIAESSDYIHQASQNSFESFSSESLGASEYQIQSGDTLSELAEMHGTSVAHIMELNPSITNPNVIMAGDEILIPQNDQVSGPYDGWQPEWSDSIDNSQNYTSSESNFDESIGEEILLDDEYEVSSFDENEDYSDSGENYETMDWQSFEDQPMDDYASSLNQEDFGSYDSQYGSYDAGFDGGFDFV